MDLLFKRTIPICDFSELHFFGIYCFVIVCIVKLLCYAVATTRTNSSKSTKTFNDWRSEVFVWTLNISQIPDIQNISILTLSSLSYLGQPQILLKICCVLFSYATWDSVEHIPIAVTSKMHQRFLDTTEAKEILTDGKPIEILGQWRYFSRSLSKD